MVIKKLKITINMKKKFHFMLKKILFGFLIIMFLNPSTLQAANYPFDYLLCDSLKNANYNFKKNFYMLNLSPSDLNL